MQDVELVEVELFTRSIAYSRYCRQSRCAEKIVSRRNKRPWWLCLPGCPREVEGPRVEASVRVEAGDGDGGEVNARRLVPIFIDPIFERGRGDMRHRPDADIKTSPYLFKCCCYYSQHPRRRTHLKAQSRAPSHYLITFSLISIPSTPSVQRYSPVTSPCMVSK